MTKGESRGYNDYYNRLPSTVKEGVEKMADIVIPVVGADETRQETTMRGEQALTQKSFNRS